MRIPTLRFGLILATLAGGCIVGPQDDLPEAPPADPDLGAHGGGAGNRSDEEDPTAAGENSGLPDDGAGGEFGDADAGGDDGVDPGRANPLHGLELPVLPDITAPAPPSPREDFPPLDVTSADPPQPNDGEDDPGADQVQDDEQPYDDE